MEKKDYLRACLDVMGDRMDTVQSNYDRALQRLKNDDAVGLRDAVKEAKKYLHLAGLYCDQIQDTLKKQGL